MSGLLIQRVERFEGVAYGGYLHDPTPRWRKGLKELR